MDYSPAVPTALAGLGIATFGIGLSAGTLILLLVFVIVALGAIIIRFAFRPGASAFDVVAPEDLTVEATR